MDKLRAVEAFSALGQDTRLTTFQLLLQAGPDGVPSGEIGDQLGIRQNTMSTNLGILLNAGLVTRHRKGRTVLYSANFKGLGELLRFVIEDCCNGSNTLCHELLSKLDRETVTSNKYDSYGEYAI
ncbi:transcriptional regulator [Pseudohoeflea suaedae]|uniref:Transcriptional regulator n=1 Tax=Pseudohoeflea suaedae TaxID=877384 RepID=A0A4R5PL25_9HYPH|nr:metalloregulator ArsR/SmtB family transcription factor [Pseudohoeflea suaedae]TDH37624.1 transcriptional regulator [Pseudohoeflea suaedae]